MFIVDMQEETVIGTTPFRVKRFTWRRLNTKVSSGATQKYLQKSEENLARHRLKEKVRKLHLRHQSKRKFQKKLYKLDRQSKGMMVNAKKNCR
jgi:hypothetical protein